MKEPMNNNVISVDEVSDEVMNNNVIDETPKKLVHSKPYFNFNLLVSKHQLKF